MKARLHVFFADLQAFRRLGGTQSFDFPKHEHGPIIVGQRVKGFFEHHLQLTIISLLFRIASFRFHIQALALQQRNTIDFLIIGAAYTSVRLVNGYLR